MKRRLPYPIFLGSFLFLLATTTGCPDAVQDEPTPEPTQGPITAPLFDFEPAQIDFEKVYLEETVSETVTLYNNGDSGLYVYGAELQGGGGAFSLDDTLDGWTIAPDQLITVTVNFTPSKVQLYGASLVIRTNDENRPEASVDLAGEGWRGKDDDGDDVTVPEGDCDDNDDTVYPGAEEICDGKDNDCDGEIDEDIDLDGDGTSDCEDNDGDGYNEQEGDCNDGNPDQNPGEDELCNEIDDDCDGSVDEDEDFDQDHDGQTTCGGDCDDTNPDVNTDATEVCNGIDDNCNGQVDEGFDEDGDGTPDCTDEDGDGYSEDEGDCDDGNPEVNPGADELCNEVDDNCNGEVDESTELDLDGDGVSVCDGDCLDSDNSVYPGAEEVCNGIDDDCDTQIDEDIPTSTWYADNDKDLYGGSNTTEKCYQPNGYVATGGDCDDLDPSINPAATEICNGIDDDCDGTIDNGFDQDSDGFTICATEPDCNDEDASVYPGADEVVGDEVDQNCDGKETCYVDADDDGYRPDSGATVASADLECSGSGEASASEPAGDCEDSEETIHPNADELCNGIDDDCDFDVDDGVVYSSWYPDNDQDGYGLSSGEVVDCLQPEGSVAQGGDCDDSDASSYPGADEVVADGVDQSCDGHEICYVDADNDGYRPDSGETLESSDTDCSDSGEALSSELAGDCDDSDSAINPGAAEQCNGVDDDCDGSIDEGVKNNYYADLDGDAYGDDSSDPVSGCTLPDGYSSNASDCDDSNPAINPAATEICNEIDDDCDGVVDEGFENEDGFKDCDESDDDGDGYTENDGDCDDFDPDVWPVTVRGGYVGEEEGSYTKPYDTIQEALDNILLDCPLILVEPYTYEEQIDYVGKKVVVRSTDGPEVTFIQPVAPEGAIVTFNTFEDSTAELDGFTITGGTAELGAGIYVGDASPTLKNNLITGNTCNLGGAGLYVEGGEVTLLDNTFTDNSCAPVDGCDPAEETCELGGAALLLSGARATLYGNVFSNNIHSRVGGAIAALEGSDLIAGASGDDNIFTSNATDNANGEGAGGAIYVYNSTASISYNTFTLNSSTDAGGALYAISVSSADETVVSLIGNTFAGNTAGPIDSSNTDQGLGGAISASLATLTISDNVFSANVAEWLGGAVHVKNDSVVEITDNSFTENEVRHADSGGGGGIYLWSSSGEISWNDIVGNTSARNAGGMILISCGELLVSENYFWRNLANSSSSGIGGGLYVYGSTGGIADNEFTENASSRGGGAVLFQDSGDDLLHNLFTDNTSGTRGGAVFVTSGPDQTAFVSIRNNIFRGNSVTDSGGYGGAMCFANQHSTEGWLSRGDFINNLMLENVSDGNGAGIYIGEESLAVVMNNIAFRNPDKHGFYLYPGTSSATVMYNDAYQNGDEYGGELDSSLDLSNLAVDPGFVAYTADSDPDNDDFHLGGSSAVADQGNPAEEYNDFDGSTNDMGAYGGPEGSW